MVLKVLLSQGFCAVLLFQQFGVGIGDFDWSVFENAFAKRENVLLKVVMFVLAHHETPFAQILGGPVWPQGGDVDEETRLRVYPSRVDDVQFVENRVIGVVRIDFEHVVAAVGDAGKFKVMDRHVVEFGQIVHRAVRHLHVHVRVPGHDLAIPPPAE